MPAKKIANWKNILGKPTKLFIQKKPVEKYGKSRNLVRLKKLWLKNYVENAGKKKGKKRNLFKLKIYIYKACK